MNERTNGRTDERMENLPILQDFVPYQGRCPATAQLHPKNCVKRGKGTADHMMPLGDWFVPRQPLTSNPFEMELSTGFQWAAHEIAIILDPKLFSNLLNDHEFCIFKKI